jgi:hypothetical protein
MEDNEEPLEKCTKEQLTEMVRALRRGEREAINLYEYFSSELSKIERCHHSWVETSDQSNPGPPQISKVCSICSKKEHKTRSGWKEELNKEVRITSSTMIIRIDLNDVDQWCASFSDVGVTSAIEEYEDEVKELLSDSGVPPQRVSKLYSDLIKVLAGGLRGQLAQYTNRTKAVHRELITEIKEQKELLESTLKRKEELLFSEESWKANDLLLTERVKYMEGVIRQCDRTIEELRETILSKNKPSDENLTVDRAAEG